MYNVQLVIFEYSLDIVFDKPGQMIQYIPILILTLLIVSCSAPQPKEQKVQQQKSVEQQDTVTTLNNLAPTADPFLTSIDSINPLFIDWNFEPKEVIVLRDSLAFSRHWWLKKYVRSQKRKPGVPMKEDYQLIDSIRQFHYVRAWRYVIEEWNMKDAQAADRWYNLAVAATSSPTYALEKPPNVFWREENRIYFIMATAANIWFAHSDSVIENFAGKTKRELRSEMRRKIK